MPTYLLFDFSMNGESTDEFEGVSGVQTDGPLVMLEGTTSAPVAIFNLGPGQYLKALPSSE